MTQSEAHLLARPTEDAANGSTVGAFETSIQVSDDFSPRSKSDAREKMKATQQGHARARKT